MARTDHPTRHPPASSPAAGADNRLTREALVRCHASAVLAVCVANTHDSHDAEDVMQDVFLKAFVKLATLRDPQRARAWLLQIARRQCIDHQRRRPVASPITSDVAAPVKCRDPRIERLHAAISQLPEAYRETITLYYLDGRECANVAASLGISEAAVRQRLLRGRLMLHDLLTENER